MLAQVDCPLRSFTPRSWAARVLADVPALLNDHAHLEKKAAANALALLPSWPAGRGADGPPEGWVRAVTTVANDETEHLRLVLRLLEKRGGQLSRHHHNPYAAALRGWTRLGDGPRECLDRLLVCALIELRSCERFAVLAQHLEDLADTPAADPELHRLYKGLFASEHGHFRSFLDLALDLPGVDRPAVEARFQEALAVEAEIIGRMPVSAGMHSGTDPGAAA